MVPSPQKPSSGRAYCAVLALCLVALLCVGLYFRARQRENERLVGMASVDPFLYPTPQPDLWAQRSAKLEPERAALVAIRLGRTEELKALLEAGLSPATTYGSNGSLVAVAAAYGQMEIIRLLVGRRAPIEPVGAMYRDPLYAAAANGHTEILSYLIRLRRFPIDTPVNVLIFARPRSGVGVPPSQQKATLLDIAVRHKHMDTATFLLAAGADVNRRDGTGATALFSAIGASSPAMVKLLLDHGADAGIVTQNGMTPLRYAAQFRSSNEMREIARLLRQRSKR